MHGREINQNVSGPNPRVGFQHLSRTLVEPTAERNCNEFHRSELFPQQNNVISN